MPAWLIPVLKSILPHVGTIVSAAAPVFTRKSADASSGQTALLQQQITELQTAAFANDAHIKALATQLQNAVEALERETSLREQIHRRAMRMCISSLIVSVISLCAVAYLGLGR
jgi:hypothetical protein